MIKIRLQLLGAKKKPFYRIVATDKRVKLIGKPLEVVGHWNPAKKMLVVDNEKIDGWVKKGAILTPAVKDLLSKKG